jgi:hypothetical protein
MNIKRTLALLIATGGSLTGLAAEMPSLDPHLEPLRLLLDKTWKGEFKASTPDKPIIDVARWERALNGQAVRVVHSINDGIYGGEVIMVWDKDKQQVGYHYFTTAGFTSVGTVRVEGTKVITHEVITGSAEGITEVRAVSEIHPDGTFTVKSEHLKDGKWVPGHEATYHEDSSAKVIFR